LVQAVRCRLSQSHQGIEQGRVQALLYLHARRARGTGAGLSGEDTVYSTEQIGSHAWAQTMKTPEQLGW